jgi:hypothetical protein
VATSAVSCAGLPPLIMACSQALSRRYEGSCRSASASPVAERSAIWALPRAVIQTARFRGERPEARRLRRRLRPYTCSTVYEYEYVYGISLALRQRRGAEVIGAAGTARRST